MDATTAKRERTRALNDELRTSLDDRHGIIVMTAGVAALPLEVRSMQVIFETTAFTAFCPENDPCGEHNFAIAGQRFFQKVDYYAPDMEGGSEDPSDPTRMTRVLTIMLAIEY